MHQIVKTLRHHITTTILPDYPWNWQTFIGDLYENEDEIIGRSLTFAVPNNEGAFAIILKINIFSTTTQITILHHYKNKANKTLDLNDPNSTQTMDEIINRTLNKIKQEH